VVEVRLRAVMPCRSGSRVSIGLSTIRRRSEARRFRHGSGHTFCRAPPSALLGVAGTGIRSPMVARVVQRARQQGVPNARQAIVANGLVELEEAPGRAVEMSKEVSRGTNGAPTGRAARAAAPEQPVRDCRACGSTRSAERPASGADGPREREPPSSDGLWAFADSRSQERPVRAESRRAPVLSRALGESLLVIEGFTGSRDRNSWSAKIDQR